LYGERPIYADVAVLRSWPSMAYNGMNWIHGPFICEQGLWEARIPFAIIFDHNLAGLSRYRVVLLANQDALSDSAMEHLRAFVEAGGGVVATGGTGQRDDWRRIRPANALTETFGLPVGSRSARLRFGKGRVAYLPRLEPPAEFRAGESQRGNHAETAFPPKNWRAVEAALRWAAGGPGGASPQLRRETRAWLHPGGNGRRRTRLDLGDIITRSAAPARPEVDPRAWARGLYPAGPEGLHRVHSAARWRPSHGAVQSNRPP
jgi:hypothetical protein